MKKFIFALLIALASFGSFAAEREALIIGGNVELRPDVCNVVYAGTKVIAREAALDIDEINKLNSSDFADAFARSVLLPLSKDPDRDSDEGVRLTNATLFIRKNMSAILGDVVRYTDKKMTPDKIGIQVAQLRHLDCSAQSSFHTETLYVK